jgi:Peptidase family M49
MKLLAGLAFALVFLSAVPIATAQKHQRVMYGSAAKGADSAGLVVAPDLARRLAKFREVTMPFDSAALTSQERQMVAKLVEASGYLDQIFWQQSDPDALTLYQSLAGSKNLRDQQLRRYLWINGARFDLIDENKPFVGTAPMPPGRGFYPQGLTQEQIAAYVKAHPGKKAEIYSSYTVVRWDAGQLQGIPYHVAYFSLLQPAAKDLRDAAQLASDPAFAKFLRLRADALLSDDYFPSDLAWVDLKNPKFDIIFAPYESYLDYLMGVKTSYEAAILIRNEEESRKLQMFQKYVPEIQDALPLPPEDRPSKRGLQTPMEVMDVPYWTGDFIHGYQAVADNLPNDPRIHEQKGSKKIFFKNFMDARVNYIVLPLARHVMAPRQAEKVSGEGYLSAVVLHEISHGLGPAFARTPSGKVDIREAIGPIYSGLEEAKADVVGMYGLKWLVDRGALPKAKLEEYYSSYVAGIFRSVRFGTGEAHGQAQLMEFNYLSGRGAIKYQRSGKFLIDYAAMPGALADLAKELLQIEATGDRARAERWFKTYDVMTPELVHALASASNVPVDIAPQFSFQ